MVNRDGNRHSGQMRSILPQPIYDSAEVIAKKLHEEDCLEEPSVEALAVRTLSIIIKEYAENPLSFISYYRKRQW